MEGICQPETCCAHMMRNEPSKGELSGFMSIVKDLLVVKSVFEMIVENVIVVRFVKSNTDHSRRNILNFKSWRILI